MSMFDKIDQWITEELASGSEKRKQVEKLFDFFKNNPEPKDADIHAMSDKEGIDTHKFEEIVYFIVGSFIGNGKAKEKGFELKDADPKELEMGAKVEMEHTTCVVMATRIALDHLAEIPDYYTRLAKMEKEAGIKD